MADTECGWCGRLAHMPAVTGMFLVPEQPHHGQLYQAAYQCPSCSKLNVATESVPARDSYPENHPRDTANLYKWSSRVGWLPQFGDEREYPDVPPHIAAAASEATLCLSVDAYRAVGALARAVIEATAKDKEAAGSSLYARIEALADEHHIRPHTKDQAHEIRHFGNDMAHGDFASEVSAEEAAEIIELMSEILNEVYQSPARLAQRKQARLAKKAREATP